MRPKGVCFQGWYSSNARQSSRETDCVGLNPNGTRGIFFFYALHPGCLGNVSMYPYVCVYFSYLGISFSSLLLPIGFLESDIYFYAKA